MTTPAIRSRTLQHRTARRSRWRKGTAHVRETPRETPLLPTGCRAPSCRFPPRNGPPPRTEPSTARRRRLLRGGARCENQQLGGLHSVQRQQDPRQLPLIAMIQHVPPDAYRVCGYCTLRLTPGWLTALPTCNTTGTVPELSPSGSCKLQPSADNPLVASRGTLYASPVPPMRVGARIS
jgi:hypothetical protein